MSKSKNEKNAEKAIAKKTLTPVKKVEEPVVAETPVVEAKTEEPVAETKTETSVTVVKAEKPAMPGDFCMDPSDWDSNRPCYDASANNCKSCESDFPVSFAACVARAKFLAGPGKPVKAARKSSGPKAARVNKDGKTPQSTVIDGYIKAEMTVAEMIVELAKADFGGEEAPALKASKGRVASHLNAIRKGTYCRTAEMLPLIAYLTVVAAPVVAE